MSSSRQTGRPLLPRPSNLSAPSGSNTQPRVQKASIACTECRRQRAKVSRVKFLSSEFSDRSANRTQCIGGMPCQRCRQKETPCVLDKESDRRRKGVLESRVEALERDRTLLLRLLDSIRDGSQNESDRLLNYIRSHRSADDVREFLAHDLPSRDPDHSEQPVRINSDPVLEDKPRNRAQMPLSRILTVLDTMYLRGHGQPSPTTAIMFLILYPFISRGITLCTDG